MNRPYYFELPADNPETLADFYCRVFGWTKNHLPGMADYVMLFTGAADKPGMNGGIMGRHIHGTVNTIEVADIDASMKKVIANGGKITMPKTHMDKLGDFTWCEDIDNNAFVLSHLDPEFDAFMKPLIPKDTPDLVWTNRPIHFEIPGAEPAKLADFYVNVFGWEKTQWEGSTDYILMRTGSNQEAGSDGAITKKGNLKYTVNTIGVTDIDLYLKRVVAEGGKVLSPKELIPKIGYFAYCLDPEGNQFGIIQPDMQM